jgi:hypothetical protein
VVTTTDPSRFRPGGTRPFWPVSTLAGLSLLLALPVLAAKPTSLTLQEWSVLLPGAPATVVTADVNGDGRKDLVVVVAFNQWDQIETFESAAMDDVEGLVEVMTIVPSLVDRREVRVYLAQPEGGYEPRGRGLPLPLSVLSMEAGPPGTPVVALTDEGVSALRLDETGAPRLVPLIADPPVLAGTGTFLPNLGLVRDLSGDGVPDLLLPARDGLAVYLGGADGLSTQASARLPVPGEVFRSADGLEHRYPLPLIQDLNGDRLPDLVFRDPVKRWEKVTFLRNTGNGRFHPQDEVDLSNGEAKDAPSPVFVGDLDGDGSAEVVDQKSLDKEDAGGIRKEMQQVREPKSRLSFRKVGKGLKGVREPHGSFDIVGYAFEGGDSEFNFPGGFQDLNGDGRMDLVTITMDLTVPKLMGSVATKRLTIGLDFHVWCQGEGGAFQRVRGLDLSGKFRINFNDLQVNENGVGVSQISQFSGDFDGDGRSDFVQIGRGRAVTIHRGRPDCSFPATPDLTVNLREEPRDISLVQVRDIDGDKRSDLLVLQPQKATEPGMAPPVRLDFYLSGKPSPPAPLPSTPTPPRRERGDQQNPGILLLFLLPLSRRGGRGGFGRGGRGVRARAAAALFLPFFLLAALPTHAQVRTQRLGTLEVQTVPLPGVLLRAVPSRDLAGRPGLALLVASGKDQKARSLLFFDPARRAVDKLADGLHEESNVLAAFDFDGDGSATPVVGLPGALWVPTAGGGKRQLLERAHLDLRSLAGDGLGLSWPAGLPWIPAARAGLLELLAPGPGGGLQTQASFPLPLKAERPRWGIRLTSPPVTLLGGRGGVAPLFAVGPETHGKRRLKTLLLSPGGEPVESWSLLPGDERLIDKRPLWLDGRPALAVTTLEKIGIFAKKRFRLFWLERDRSRKGTAPVLAVETDCPLWFPVDTVAADADGDGREDLGLVHPEGMGGGDLQLSVFHNEGNRFAARPRRIKLSLEPRAWHWGADFTRDGTPDLLVLGGGKLQLFPGEAKGGRPVAARAAWSVAVGKEKSKKDQEDDREDRDGPDAGGGWAVEVVDVEGDGVPEILARGEEGEDRSVLMVVRR